MTSLDIRGAEMLATPVGTSARRGPEQGAILRIRKPAVRAEDGVLVFVGTEADYRREYGNRPADVTVDATGRTLLPGLVDAHTHPVWVGDRGEEIGRRLAGESYSAIAESGGGILATVRATRAATDESSLPQRPPARRSAARRDGARPVGYGLTPRRVRSSNPGDLAAEMPWTFALLAAHDVPPVRGRREGGRIVADELVSQVAGRSSPLCDVFCEDGVLRRRVTAHPPGGGRAGLGLRIHADELTLSGGALLAAELGAASADHLLFAGDAEIAALARSGTVAVVLPGTAWWMRSRRAPARAMISAGVPVAVASDANPGTCYTESLAAVAAHACLDSGLTVEETLTGMTLNAAASLGLAAEVGSLEAGKSADVLVLDAPNDRHLVYHWGINLMSTVVLRGRVAA